MCASARVFVTERFVLPLRRLVFARRHPEDTLRIQETFCGKCSHCRSSKKKSCYEFQWTPNGRQKRRWESALRADDRQWERAFADRRNRRFHNFSPVVCTLKASAIKSAGQFLWYRPIKRFLLARLRWQMVVYQVYMSTASVWRQSFFVDYFDRQIIATGSCISFCKSYF